MTTLESVQTIDRLCARGWKVRIKPVRWWLPWGMLTGTFTPPPGYTTGRGAEIVGPIVVTSHRRGMWVFIDALDRYW